MKRIAVLCALMAAAGASQAGDTIRAVVRNGDQVRAIALRRDGSELLIHLFACGSILGAEARWNQPTNRWSLRSKTATAQGFLDEPLLILSGQPLLLKSPPRLVGGTAYLSLEALRLLGRHGWDVEVAWEEGARELVVRPVQLQAPDVAPHLRSLTVPGVAAGARAVLLDAGHARHGGIPGLKGATEGDLGLKLAATASATLAAAPGIAPVVLQGEGDEYEPSEVASIANALPAERFVSMHASENGVAGVAVWCWGLANMLATGIGFAPFEPPAGQGAAPWAYAAAAGAPRSQALARRLVRTLSAAGIPARGPFVAPLLALEGVACPAVVLDLEGIGTPEGAAIAGDDAALIRLGGATGAALIEDLAASAHPEGAP